MADLQGELLAASIMADKHRRKAALRVLRGDVPVDKDPEASLLLKAGPASRLLGVSKPFFYRLVREGRIKSVDISSKHTFYRRRDILALAHGEPES